MGSTTTSILISVVALFFVAFVVDSASAVSRCPPPSTIYEYKKQQGCHSDSQCSGGKVCCPTPSGYKDCVTPAFGSQLNAQYYKDGKKTATGLYCGNKKCHPSERCVKDQQGRPVCRH